jgi:hypothetical protein
MSAAIATKRKGNRSLSALDLNFVEFTIATHSIFAKQVLVLSTM